MLIFSQGFDYIPSASTTDILGALGYFNILGATTSTETRFGVGRSLTFGATNNSGDRTVEFLIREQAAEGFIGAAMRIDADHLTQGRRGVFKFRDTTLGVTHLTITFENFGVIRVYRGDENGTLLSTSESLSFFANVWFYAEFRVVINDASGICEVRINTIPVIELENVDTKNGAGGNFFDSVRHGSLGGSGSTILPVNIWFDDMYVNDTAGSKNNTYLGNSIARASGPAGAGNSTEWNRSNVGLANWENASNTDIDDTLYVYSDVPGDYDLYTIDPVFTSPTIFALVVKGFYRQDDGTQMFASNVIESNGTLVAGETVACMSTYAGALDVFENDPDTGVGWTPTAANLVQIGPMVSGGIT